MFIFIRKITLIYPLMDFIEWNGQFLSNFLLCAVVCMDILLYFMI